MTANGQRFTISQVALATAVPANTIRSWYQRGHLTVGMTTVDEDPKANGHPRFFSSQTAIAIAIVGALTAYGIAVDRAAAAGIKFAHTGHGGGGAVGAVRQPGELYARGATVLAIGTERSEVLNITGEARFADVFRPRILGSGSGHPVISYLELDDLVLSVMQRLERIAEDLNQTRRRSTDAALVLAAAQ